MKNRIVLAADPFSDSDIKSVNALKSLRNFAAVSKSEIVAVTIVSPDRIKTPFNFDDEYKKSFSQVGEKWLGKWLSAASSGKVRREVILQPLQSTGKSIRALFDFVEKEGAEILAVLTHTGKRAGFTLSGSFTSQLMQRSKTPILVLDARTPASTQFKKLLFATDFSPGGRRALDAAIKWSRRLNAELVILNVLIDMPKNMAGSEFVAGGMDHVQKYLETQQKWAKKVSGQWIKIAEEAGVRASAKLPRSTAAIPGAVIEVAKKEKIDLLLLHSNTTAREALIFGSTSREILRRGGIPTMVIP